METKKPDCKCECSTFILGRELLSSAQEGPFEVIRDLSQPLLFYLHPETSEGEGGYSLMLWFVYAEGIELKLKCGFHREGT